MINYKVFKCRSLIKNIDNYRHNKAVMIASSTLFINILLFIIFFCHGLPKIRIIMYNEIPTDKKIHQLIIENKRKKEIMNLMSPLKKNSIINIERANKKHKSVKKEGFLEININNRSNKSVINFQFHHNHKGKTNKSINTENIYKKSKSRKDLLTSNLLIDKNKIKKELTKSNNEDNIEYDNLPFSLALKLDKRNIFYIFGLKILEKIKIIDIFVNRKIKEIILSEYILYLLIELAINAILYSDNIVSHKSHNNGQLDFIVVLILTIFSNIISSIIGYYLECLIDFEEKINLIKDIKIEKEFLRVFNIIIREAIIRVVIFFILDVIIFLFCTYYLFVFFTIYHKSQMSLLKNYLISILEEWLINLIIVFFIVSFRKMGIQFKNKYLYNISKFLDKNF